MGDHAGPHDHPAGDDGHDHPHGDEPHDHPHAGHHAHGYASPRAGEQPGPRPDDAVLDIGGDVGALILYTSAAYDEREIEVSPVGDDARRTHTAIHLRRSGDDATYAGIFPQLQAGRYRIWADRPGLVDQVTIVGGEVVEVDWR